MNDLQVRGSRRLWALALLAWALALLAVLVVGLPDAAQAAMGDSLHVEKLATLYARPALDANKVTTVNRAQQLFELERMGAWVLVAVGKTGMQGWARMSALVPASVAHHVNRRTSLKIGEKVKRSDHNVSLSTRSSGRVAAISNRFHPSRGSSEAFLHKSDSTLRDIGLEKGVVFEGSGGRSKALFFSAPLDSRVTSGEFILRYQASSLMLAKSSLRIAINDISVRASRIPTDGMVHRLSVLLPPSLLRHRGLVKVSIEVRLIGSDDRCRDEREGANFIRILPESALHLSYSPQLHSVRDYWRMLPHHVQISLPAGQLTPELFKAAWSLMVLLEQSGRKATLVRFPNLGQIAIAPKALLDARLKSQLISEGNIADFAHRYYPALQVESNVSLIRYGRHRLLAINEPFDTNPFYLLDNHWNTLASGQHYRLFPLAYGSYLTRMHLPKSEFGHDFTLPVEKIGINTKAQKMFRSTSWSTTIGPYDLPAHSRMHQLKLNVVAPISEKRDPDFELYVYLNDILLRSMRLENSGVMQTMEVMLPTDYQIQFNKLQIVAEHDVDNGDCRGLPPTDPFQVLPSSQVILKRQQGDPKNFFDLTYYFADGFDTYIASDYLKKADRLLYLLTRISVDYPILADMDRIHFVSNDFKLHPDKPFWAIGNFDLSEIKAPVRFDKGRVNVIDKDGTALLSVDQLARITIMQIAHTDEGVSGLLIRPDGDEKFRFPRTLHLQRDDVAFVDDNGILLSMDSDKPTLVRMYYPDITTWFEVFDAYRFWFFIAGWFLLTLLALYLFRQMRRRKNSSPSSSLSSK